MWCQRGYRRGSLGRMDETFHLSVEADLRANLRRLAMAAGLTTRRGGGRAARSVRARDWGGNGRLGTPAMNALPDAIWDFGWYGAGMGGESLEAVLADRPALLRPVLTHRGTFADRRLHRVLPEISAQATLNIVTFKRLTEPYPAAQIRPNRSILTIAYHDAHPWLIRLERGLILSHTSAPPQPARSDAHVPASRRHFRSCGHGSSGSNPDCRWSRSPRCWF